MTSEQLRAEKNKFRTKAKQFRTALTGEQSAELEKKIAENVISLRTFDWAKDVLLYYSFKGEPGTKILFDECIKRGKNVYFPKSYDGGIMKFFRVHSLSEMTSGKYGICEPEETADALEYDENVPALCIVPSLCLDVRGYRIGYGKGYYDRFIKARPGYVFCGLQYSALVLDEVVFDKRHDKKLDIIVTEEGKYVLGQEE